jgi:hypothetical protein
VVDVLKDRGAGAVEIGAAADVARVAVVAIAVAGFAAPNMTGAGVDDAAAVVVVDAAGAPKAVPVEGEAAAAGLPPNENAIKNCDITCM